MSTARTDSWFLTHLAEANLTRLQLMLFLQWLWVKGYKMSFANLSRWIEQEKHENHAFPVDKTDEKV